MELLKFICLLLDSALELIGLDWNVMAFVHMHCLLKQSIRILTSIGGVVLWLLCTLQKLLSFVHV